MGVAHVPLPSHCSKVSRDDLAQFKNDREAPGSWSERAAEHMSLTLHSDEALEQKKSLCRQQVKSCCLVFQLLVCSY